MPGNDNNANAPAATGASKMLAMLPKITKWVTSGDANALSSRNRSSWRAARINFIMALTALSFWNVLLKIGEKATPPVGGLVSVACVCVFALRRRPAVALGAEEAVRGSS